MPSQLSAPYIGTKPERQTQCRRLPGVVPLLGSFEDDASVCLVQELCGRSDLFKRLVTSGGTIPEQELCLTVSFSSIVILAAATIEFFWLEQNRNTIPRLDATCDDLCVY